MRRELMFAVLAAVPAWGASCSSAQAGNWSAAATWGASGCVGASGPNNTPGLGDTVYIQHAVVQDVANLIAGVNGAAPETSYLLAITGGGGTGYTSCSASLSGGTAVRTGSIGCAVVNGVVTPYIVDRGSYSACPGITITASGGSGAALPGSISCAAAGGTPAIRVKNVSTATLTIAADTYVRGTLQLDGSYSNYGAALILRPGANLYMDMTQANDVGDSAMYRIEDGGSVAFTRAISADCSGGAQCSIQGLGGATSWESQPTTADYYPYLVAKNAYFKNVGNGNTLFGVVSNNKAPTGGGIDIENSTFDACGRISIVTDNASENQVYIGNIWKNSPRQSPSQTALVTTVNVYGGSLANATGLRLMTNNSFDGGLTGSGGAVWAGFTITGNYFGQGLSPNAGWAWASFTDNFWRLAPVSGASGELTSAAGNISRVYGFLDVDHIVNPHFFTGGFAASVTIDGFIGGFSGHNTGDSGEWILFMPGTSGVLTTQNSLFLCDSTGVGSSEITSVLGGWTTAPNTNQWAYLHDTRCGGYQTVGTVDINETGNTRAGALTFKSNLTWETAQGTHTGLKLFSLGSGTDACTTTSATSSNCDFNGSYQIGTSEAGYTNSGRGYGGAWSYTPGYHDVDGQDPRFVDPSRKVENFDRKYLGKLLSPQWVNGAAYNYGDLASNSDSHVYQGEVFNFRCINPSGCTGLGGPGIYNTEWRANWEWASLYWLRELTFQKAQYTDGSIGCSGCSAIQALNAWVMAGFAVQNPAYWSAGHNGRDIGAAHLPLVRHMPLAAVIP
jgi:hypothetical protein